MLLACAASDAASPSAGSKRARKRSTSQPGDRRIGAERALHVVLAEGDAGLAQVLGVGAQDRDLAPGEPGAQHQPVQPVALQRAGPQLVERLGEARPDRGEIDRRLVGGLDAQHLQRHRLARRGACSRNGASLSTRRPRFSASGRMSDSAIGFVRMEQAQA